MTDEALDERAPQTASGVIAAILLALALLAGGASREAFLADGALQVISALLLGWCVLDARRSMTGAGRVIIWLAVALGIVCGISLAPLPPEIWTALPGRAEVAAGFVAMGDTVPWLPLSLVPDATVGGLLKFLPPLAMFVLVARLHLPAISAAVPWTLLAVASVSVLVGIGQVVGGPDSVLYLHDFTNRNSAVGFMANANHQAVLLLMVLPFTAVLLSRLSVRAELGDRDLGLGLIIAAAFCVLALGAMIAGSLAGYGLMAPALILTLMTGHQREWGAVSVAIMLALLLVLGGLAAIVAGSPVLEGLGVTNWSTASLSRPDTYARTLEAIRDMLPAGAGLGSFEAVFPAYEDAATVARDFMNHAHSDYLEVVLDLGIAGVLLIIAFLVWFAVQTFAIWQRESSDGVRLRRGASGAVLIVLLHSMVDYPLRTPAIACLTALCLAIMAAPASARAAARDQRQSRADLDAPADGKHLVL